jgi:hypothetical protein
MPSVWLISKPLSCECRLAVAGGRNEKDGRRLGFVKQPRKPWALDDVAPRRGFRIRLPCFHFCQLGLLRPADRLVLSATIYDRRIETSRTRSRERPRVRCRQSPASGATGARPCESGSSPVSSRYARGICLRRGTPSFCRRTSQCAFAVLGEMPSRSPTSSLEQPSAISSTTCFCRSVRTGGLAWSIVGMASTVTTKSPFGY